MQDYPSFAIAMLSLLVSIASFIIGNKDSQNLRYVFGVVMLVVALVFFGIGTLSYINDGETETSIQPENSTTRPDFVHIVNGIDYSLPKDWVWVCTGDFSTKINGNQKALYDVGVSHTGLVLVLQPNSNFTISGPFDMSAGLDVGDCRPFTQNDKDTGISSAIQMQVNMGCGSKCLFVNIIELDKDGNEVSNYWTPQHP